MTPQNKKQQKKIDFINRIKFLQRYYPKNWKKILFDQLKKEFSDFTSEYSYIPPTHICNKNGWPVSWSVNIPTCTICGKTQ